MKSLCEQGATFHLIPRNLGKEKGWIIDGFELTQTDTLSIPDSYEGLPILGLFERPYRGAYPEIKRLSLGRWLRELKLHDGLFPSLEELTIDRQGAFVAEGTCLFSREGRLLYCLGDLTEKEELLPRGEGIKCLSNETQDLVVKGDTLVSVGVPVDTLVLPEGVRRLGEKAFAQHAPRRIEGFHLLKGEGEKPLYEFPGIDQVKELVVKGKKETISQEALLSWPSLERVHLPLGTDSLLSQEGILYSADGKTLVFFPPHHPFGRQAFRLPERVEKIGEKAFAYSQVTRVEMGDQVREVGKNAFLRCEKLLYVHLSDSIQELPGSGLHARYVYLSGVFGGCKNLSFVRLPQSLKRIGANAFFQSGLTSVSLPQGVEEIGVRAFYGTKMEQVQIPESVKSVGRDAFLGEVKRLIAWEGTARGLLLSASSGKGAVVRVRVLSRNAMEPSFDLPIPINYRGTLDELLLRAWDGEEIDWEAYAQCTLKVREEDVKLEMSFLSSLHLDKKRAAPLKKNLSGKELLLGELLLRQEETELFSLYLRLLKPSRKVMDTLLEMCNREGKHKLIPILLQENKGKGGGRSWEL